MDGGPSVREEFLDDIHVYREESPHGENITEVFLYLML